MLNLNEIDITEQWNVMKNECIFTARALVEGQYVATVCALNADPVLRDRIRVQIALAVFSVLYGDLQDDMKEMLLMLKLTHPDQVRVAEIEHRVGHKLGVTA